ncbi:MAG: hypothetical protein ACRYF4_14135 [Janthinobacterium lividum]
MSDPRANRTSDEGYLLISLVVVCFLLILALGIAAPRVAKQLERDREVESEHRALEYVRAIQLYYKKTQRYPSSIEQLLGTGTTGISAATNVKYLRQQYKDPLTRDDYRLIQVGTAKTEVKGFFGEPLAGAPAGNLGSVAGMQSNAGGTGGSAFGGSTPGTSAGSGSSFGSTSSFGSSSSFGGTQASGSTGSSNGSGLSSGSSQASGSAGGSGSSTGSSFGSGTSATSFQGSKGAFLGVGSNAKGAGLVEWNGSENIQDWEFLYDPRVELLKAKVSIFGGSPAASGSGSLGGSIGAGSTSIFAPTSGSSSSGTGGLSGTPSSVSPTGSFGSGSTPQQ